MTSRNAYMTSRFSVPASAGPLLPLLTRPYFFCFERFANYYRVMMSHSDTHNDTTMRHVSALVYVTFCHIVNMLDEALTVVR